MTAARRAAAGLPVPSSADRDCLARTLWAEAGSDGLAAMAGIAAMVVNRMAASARSVERGGAPLWWGGPDAVSVCRAPWQFPCWSRDNPLRAGMLALAADDSRLAAARMIADAALDGRLGDPVAGANHCHARTERPAWARGRRPLAVIGPHCFYRL